MKTPIFVLLAVGTVLVAADDFKKVPEPHHEANHHGTNVQQHPAAAQHQLKQQQPQDYHHQAGQAPQQHQLKEHEQQNHQAGPGPQQHQLKQHEQPLPHQHHKRDAPKRQNAPAQSTTAAPKVTVDPKQPSAQPAIVSQPPKQKRDTVAANPAQSRPTTSAPAKGVNGGNQQHKNQPRPTGGAKVNRDQPKVPLQVPQPTANAKAPAEPAKKQ